jgi:PAS domain S-box-containing protein
MIASPDRSILISVRDHAPRIRMYADVPGNARISTGVVEPLSPAAGLEDQGLLQELERAQQLLDVAPIIVVALDLAGHVTSINRYGCALLGWSADELKGRVWIDECLPERIRAELTTVFQAALDGGVPTKENAVLTRSGEERLIAWHNAVTRDAGGKVTGTISYGTDVTQLRSLEDRFREAQDTAGALVEGAAHDFNNVLAALLGYSELLRGALDPADPRWADADEIRKACIRAGAITRRLLGDRLPPGTEPEP